ncbi:MAG: hypothetical protein QOI63_1011 [Thermoplasmata archaeon]|jgi:hypothetical protein|nr:hypothetical protein [Thermoplasmata archaeon]
MRHRPCKIAIPIRLPSWLTGDLGKSIEQTLRGLLRELPSVELTRLPRGFMVEAHEAPGPMLEAVHRAVLDLEARVEEAYPVLHVEMGPLWTGTLQTVFPTASSRDRVPAPLAAPLALPAAAPSSAPAPTGAPGAA